MSVAIISIITVTRMVGGCGCVRAFDLDRCKCIQLYGWELAGNWWGIDAGGVGVTGNLLFSTEDFHLGCLHLSPCVVGGNEVAY